MTQHFKYSIEFLSRKLSKWPCQWSSLSWLFTEAAVYCLWSLFLCLEEKFSFVLQEINGTFWAVIYFKNISALKYIYKEFKGKSNLKKILSLFMFK